jgi:hypothetical protein
MPHVPCAGVIKKTPKNSKIVSQHTCFCLQAHGGGTNDPNRTFNVNGIIYTKAQLQVSPCSSCTDAAVCRLF